LQTFLFQILLMFKRPDWLYLWIISWIYPFVTHQ